MAEGDLLLAPAAPMLSFVPTLLGLAVGGMADVAVGGFADLGDLTDKRGLTDAPAAIGRLTKGVRARGAASPRPGRPRWASRSPQL